MKTYIDYKKDIIGYEDLAATMKAIEKKSASQIHMLKQKTKYFKSYIEKIIQILRRLDQLGGATEVKDATKSVNQGEYILLVIGGDRGLVSGLWHAYINKIIDSQNNYSKILVIGKKVTDLLLEEDLGLNIEKREFPEDFSEEDVHKVNEELHSLLKRKEIFGVDVLYVGYQSLTKQKPVIVRYLPFNFKEDFQSDDSETKEGNTRIGLPLFNVSSHRLREILISKYISAFLYRLFIETRLSELSARTNYTEHASGKTEKLVRKLMLGSLKIRRKVTTQKQLETFAAHMKI
jgi:ATP synthase F1 gamma subunit